MADVLIGVVVEGILKKALSLAAQELGFKKERQRLTRRLEMVQALLADAERKQTVRESSVQSWLKNLKAAAHEADHVLDKVEYEVLRRKVEVQDKMKNKVHDFLSLSNNPLVFRCKMASKIKNMKLKFDEIYKEANEIGLKPVELSNTTVERRENRVEHPPFIHDSEVVGRDNDVSVVVDMLLSSNNEENLSIVTIVGMGGLGKTALAQLIYNKENVVRHFDKRIWVCVSNDFDVNRLLNKMVQSLTTNNPNLSTLEATINKLQQDLKEKKYLLVLDDVWNEDLKKHWEPLRKSLQGVGGSIGSKIMVTTRSEEVVSTLQTSLTHKLVGLSNDDSWTIFEQRAFAKGGAPETENLVAVGRRMVKRCGGVPLAIKALGGLMYSKKDVQEWSLIEGSKIWDSPQIENEILPSLRLSFDHLPSASKQCFAYCSIFLPDCVIEKDDIIQLWMALGFLQPPLGSNKLMEDLGDYHFKTLLLNSFFQDVEKDEYDNITNCKMHDLVHDLARSISEFESFAGEATTVTKILDVRHLALYSNEGIIRTIPKASAKSFNTLFLKSNVLGDKLVDFKCLRVLNFCGAEIKELPSSIGKLIHLRYLNLQETNIKALPKSIAKLYNLQTLRLEWCQSFKELPNELRNLVSLRHLYFNYLEGCQMPLGIGRLTCLQTLPLFYVGQHEGHRIEELGYLKNLRGTLEILNLERVGGREEAQRADLAGKANIYQLEFVWSGYNREGNNNDENTLEGLQPHPNLKGLTILNFAGDKFPSWMMKMEVSINGRSEFFNLVNIAITGCRSCEKLPMLGHLQFLRDLSLTDMDNVKCIDGSFYGHNSYSGGSSSGDGGDETIALFPALRTFYISDMGYLEKWMEAEVMRRAATGVRVVVVFPCLEMLTISECPNLKTAPSHFPCLKRLRIYSVNSSSPLENICSNLTTLTDLKIEKLSELKSLPDGLLQKNRSLTYLTILECCKLTHIVPHVRGGTSLRSLRIESCENLCDLPDGLYPSLEKLSISKCPNLKSIQSIDLSKGGLTSLQDLTLNTCEGLTSLPSGLLQSCTSLRNLVVWNCPNLISFPDLQQQQLPSLSSLWWLGLGGFSKELNSVLLSSLDGILKLDVRSSLRILQLDGLHQFDSLPEQLQHLTALTSIRLRRFGMEALPDWFGNFSSLEFLDLFECEKLKYLPTMEAMRRLTKLEELEIYACPLLKERCVKESGPEWPKISHIRFITIGNVRIQ